MLVMIDSSALKAHRYAAGGKGGRKSGDRPFSFRANKENPRPDGRTLPPIAFMLMGGLMGGNLADCAAGATLLEPLPECDVVNADKSDDPNALRPQIQERGALANIPPKANRKWKSCFSPFLYRRRNAIERMF